LYSPIENAVTLTLGLPVPCAASRLAIFTKFAMADSAMARTATPHTGTKNGPAEAGPKSGRNAKIEFELYFGLFTYFFVGHNLDNSSE
jgi:hypothetical protein